MSSLTWITGQEVDREITLVQNEFTSDFASFTTDVQTYLLQGFLFRRWWNAQHRYSTRFAAMLQKKVARFLLPVLPYLLIFCRCRRRRRLTLHNFILSKLQFFFKVNYNYNINESFPFSPGYIYIVGIPWGKERNTWNFGSITE